MKPFLPDDRPPTLMGGWPPQYATISTTYLDFLNHPVPSPHPEPPLNKQIISAIILSFSEFAHHCKI
jgi:hypothetical protein